MVGLLLLAFTCEYIDSTLGMGYGTILSPVLIIAGMAPLVVVPSILISQAVGGLTASVFHHRFENMEMTRDSKDTRVAMVIILTGLVATVVGVVVAIQLPAVVLKTYIGLLVLAMGVIILAGKRFSFSWNKIVTISVLSAFNKALSGGGFGPVVTSGQIISGQETRNSIGITTVAEAPICISSFILYLVLNGGIDPLLPVLLTIGAVAGAPLGARDTKMRDPKLTLKLVGVATLALGAYTLVKTYLP
jgi:uncharacterized membrane protein YfcA